MIKFDLLPEKPQSSCFAKWYSWKAVKNRVALDLSNNDPAGRAEQLKESPEERWELLTATEDLLSPRFTHSLSQPGLAKLYTDENIAGNTEKALIKGRGGEGGERDGRSPVLQRHFLSNLICCISYFWSAVSCIKLCIFTSSHDSTGFADWTQSKSSKPERNRKLGKDMTV